MIEFNIFDKKFRAYQFTDNFDSFKEIWNEIQWRMQMISEKHKNFDHRTVLSYDDGRYDYESKKLFDLWSIEKFDTPEKAWLFLCDMNDSYYWRNIRDPYKRCSAYMPFMYESGPFDKIGFSAVNYHDYLVVDTSDFLQGIYEMPDRFIESIIKKN